MFETKLTLDTSNSAVIRMYGQGFGDCFLLAFPRQTKAGGSPDCENPVYVVIDNGVFYHTPQARDRMQAVAESLRDATGGTIDLLVISHEHQDHVSGFDEAREVWKTIGVKQIWLAWTEDPKDPTTQEIDPEMRGLQDLTLNVLHAASAARRDHAWKARIDQAAVAVDLIDSSGNLLPRDPLGGLAVGPAHRTSKGPDAIVDDLARHPEARFNAAPQTACVFCSPGDVRVVPDTKVDAFVLGPPKDLARLGLGEDQDETYAATGNRDTGLGVWADRALREGLGAAVTRRLDGDSVHDCSAPFAPAVSMAYDAAAQQDFFQEYYFGAQPMRQIEHDWLRGFGRLALQLDSVTNNTSLVLAFRIRGDRYLLFPGDAQVGSWLSWHDIKPETWHRPKGGGIKSLPTAEQLLQRTCFYKVGHHGSANATLKARGLRHLPEDFVAMIPVSQAYPQSALGWPIPAPSLLKDLCDRSRGRVLLPFDDPAHAPVDPVFARRIEFAAQHLPPMMRDGQKVEDSRPLWCQVRF